MSPSLVGTLVYFSEPPAGGITPITAGDGPGEVLHGMTVQGMTVARVLAILRQRGVTVPVYHYNDHGFGKLLHHVPVTGTCTTPIPGRRSRSCCSSARPGRNRCRAHPL